MNINELDNAIKIFVQSELGAPENLAGDLIQRLITLRDTVIYKKNNNKLYEQTLVRLIQGTWLLQQRFPEEEQTISDIGNFITELSPNLGKESNETIKQFKEKYRLNEDNGNHHSPRPGCR